MIKLKNNQSGVTVVELVIVLVVIAVLSWLLIYTNSSIQAKHRNLTRENDLKALQVQVETYFSKNGYFPNLNDINSTTWRKTNMPRLSGGDLVDPSSGCDSSKEACVGGNDKATAKQFQYYATKPDGNTSCNGTIKGTSAQDCAEYVLSTKFEGKFNGAKTYTLTNSDY